MAKRTEITTEIMDIVYRERKAKAYSDAIAVSKRQSRIEKAKAKLALSIIGGGFIGATLLGILVTEINILSNLL